MGLDLKDGQAGVILEYTIIIQGKDDRDFRYRKAEI